MKLTKPQKNQLSRSHIQKIMINMKINHRLPDQTQKIVNKSYWLLSIKQRKF